MHVRFAIACQDFLWLYLLFEQYWVDSNWKILSEKIATAAITCLQSFNDDFNDEYGLKLHVHIALNELGIWVCKCCTFKVHQEHQLYCQEVCLNTFSD